MDTPREKVSALRFQIAICFVIVLILGINVSKYFIVILFIFMLYAGIYMRTIKCPKCGKPVLYNPVNVFGIEIPIWTGTVPKNCSKCSEKL